jgi:methionine aminopeptidase
VKDWHNKFLAMQKGGAILREVLTDLVKHAQVGTTTREIDKIATELIKKYGGEVSFNKVPGYKWATCLSVNDHVDNITHIVLPPLNLIPPSPDFCRE